MTMTCPPTWMNSVTNLRAAYALLCKAEMEKTYAAQVKALTAVRSSRDFVPLCHLHQDPPPAPTTAAHGPPGWCSAGAAPAKRASAPNGCAPRRLGVGPYAERPHRSIALVGESEHDVREVMIEGVSGLLRIAPRDKRPVFLPSRRRLEWPNGAVAQAFSAEDPESLRGPQFDAAWCDELAKWRNAEDTFDMLQFGLRLGAQPRQLITTTPRPIALIKRLIADPRSAVTRAATHVNAAHLSPAFLSQVVERYAGTQLGRQEILGEIIEDRPDALWSRAGIEAARVSEAPPLARIAIGIDPPASSRKGADACGIVAAGRAEDGTVYVLEDATAAGLSPANWAMRAIALYRRLEADTLVAEVNQGGEMVRAVLREVDPAVPVKTVHATRGKWLRAEPVAAMYTQGKVKHVDPPLAALEDQMCDFGSDGRLSSGRSPDRLDAMVYAVAELTRKRAEPRIRSLGDPTVPPWSVMR